MTELLLSAHVLAAIVAIGTITVAASAFPRHARQAASGDDPGRDAAIAAFLHRICRGYAIAGLAVPVLGLATGAQMGVLTDAWLIASVVLTAVAAVVLALVILPDQRRLLASVRDGGAPEDRRRLGARLAALTGVFNILWVVVVVLMIVRPGSTTGA